MEIPSHDQRLSVYCSHGRVDSRRFKTVASTVGNHVDYALADLDVSLEIRQRILHELSRVHSFSSGYRFESSFDQHDTDRVVVYMNLFHKQLEECIARTAGELRNFDEVFPSVDEEVAENWRKTA